MNPEDYTWYKNFQGKSLLTLQDYSGEELEQILELAAVLKAEQRQGIPHPLLKGKTLGMIFTKNSTRTRVSFEVGIYQLGGYGLFLSSQDLQLGRGETIADTARVLGRYLDGIMIRTYDQADLEALAAYAGIPVINGLTDLYHPCQVLADLLTIKEHKEKLKGLKLCYVGDGNNMANSLLLGCSKMGMNIAVASPQDYRPNPRIISLAEAEAAARGSSVEILDDPRLAAQNADVFYTDVWASMGQEKEKAQRERSFAGYQINNDLLALGRPDALVLHCLPAHRGEEITDEVIEGPHSVVFDEAENRLHAQKAVMALLLQ